MRAVALIYIGVGLAAYARVIPTFFTADDFAYLEVISRAPATVVFSPLAERYFRPLVVLVYYLNYQLAGLNAWTYHLSVIVMNIANAWLVFLLGRHVFPPDLRMPALAGLLFLVFGGHAEAVSWIAGMADPLMTLFVLTALILFLRALDGERHGWALAGSFAAFGAALLSKESAAIFPGLALAMSPFTTGGGVQWIRVRRALTHILPAILIIVGYLALRHYVLGTALVNLDGLGTTTNPLSSTRAFVLRSFFAQGPLLTLVWRQWLDVYVLFPMALAVIFVAKPDERMQLALLAGCLVIALLPVLPLSIAIASTESERFIYFPSVFASLLVVRSVDAGAHRPAIAATIVLVWCSLHVTALDRANRAWQEAPRLLRDVIDSLAMVIREHENDAPIFVLNLPDNVRGAFVFRRGLHEALGLLHPDIRGGAGRVGFLYLYSGTGSLTAAVGQGRRHANVQAGPARWPAGTRTAGADTRSAVRNRQLVAAGVYGHVHTGVRRNSCLRDHRRSPRHPNAVDPLTLGSHGFSRHVDLSGRH